MWKNIFFVKFLIISFVTSLLEASVQDPYLITVREVLANVYSPDRSNDYWRSFVVVYFNNDLKAFIFKSFLYESQAQDEVDYLTNLLKNQTGHITKYKSLTSNGVKVDFAFKPLNSDAEVLNILTFDKNKSFNHLPSITSINENIATYWFSTEYSYILELSNGIVASTSVKKAKWVEPWLVNSRIFLLGNEQEPILVNFEKSESSGYIEHSHSLDYYFKQVVINK